MKPFFTAVNKMNGNLSLNISVVNLSFVKKKKAKIHMNKIKSPSHPWKFRLHEVA